VVGGLRLGIGDSMTPDYRCAFGDTCASCGWSTPTLPNSAASAAGSEDVYGDYGSGSGDEGSGSGDEGSGDAGSGAGFPPSPPPSPSPSFWGGKYSAGCDCPTVVPATLTDGGTTLTCVSPMTVAGSPALEVSLNAQDYSNSSAPFGVLSPVAVSAVAPPQGSGALT